MEIILTGTGSPLPDPNRAGPSTLIKVGATHILVDAGRGTVMRLAAAGSVPAMLSAVCITHLHSDHICALNDVITTHWIMTAVTSPGENEPLKVFGPPGTAQFVDRTMSALEPDITYRLAHHPDLTDGPSVEVTELGPGESFAIGDVRVTTAATVHTPAEPTLGYRFDHGGSSAALVGDTVPCVGVDALCSGVDAYVQTAIRDDLIAAMPSKMMRDLIDYHSSVIDAAQTASRARVKRLVLTHMIPAPNPDQYEDWRAIASQHFKGEIIIGGDLTTVTV